jgi:hypothetical protein
LLKKGKYTTKKQKMAQASKYAKCEWAAWKRPSRDGQVARSENSAVFLKSMPLLEDISKTNCKCVQH